MAKATYAFQIASMAASKHLLDADQVQGGYSTVGTIAERDALPKAVFEAVTSTSGKNPKNEDWFESTATGYYKPTTDTTPQSGKTYYQLTNDGIIVKGSEVYVAETDKKYKYDGSNWVEQGDTSVQSLEAKTDKVGTPFVNTQNYSIGDYVTYNGHLYRCKTAHSKGAWNANHFTQADGNFAALAPDGSIVDSQHKHNDYAPAEHTHDVSNKAEKSEMVITVGEGVNAGTANVQLKEETDVDVLMPSHPIVAWAKAKMQAENQAALQAEADSLFSVSTSGSDATRYADQNATQTITVTVTVMFNGENVQASNHNDLLNNKGWSSTVTGVYTKTLTETSGSIAAQLFSYQPGGKYGDITCSKSSEAKTISEVYPIWYGFKNASTTIPATNETVNVASLALTRKTEKHSQHAALKNTNNFVARYWILTRNSASLTDDMTGNMLDSAIAVKVSSNGFTLDGYKLYISKSTAEAGGDLSGSCSLSINV